MCSGCVMVNASYGDSRKCCQVTGNIWQPYRISKAGEKQWWFAIARLYLVILDFLSGLLFKYNPGLLNFC